jgi:uncharacterized protein YkwD
VFRESHISAVLAAGCLAVAAAPSALAAPRGGEAASLLRIVNATRAAHHLHSLRLDGALTRAARSHTAEMLRGNFFGHGDFYGRMVAFQLGGSLGENLAWGTGSSGGARAIVRMWLASPPHRANLLRPGYRRLGVGVATGAFHGAAGATVVTADFGG